MAARTPVPSISFRDSAFDPERSESFCLVLEISAEAISLAVLDNLTNDFLAFEHYPLRKVADEQTLAATVELLAANHDWLTNRFKRTDCILVTERFTLVPAALFDSASAAQYLRFNQPLSEADEVLTDILRQPDARNIYAVAESLTAVLRRQFAGIRFRSHLSPLIERTLSVNKNAEGRRVLVHIQQQRFDLLISDGGLLLLANTYRYQSAEDVAYYLLFACEQLRLNPEQVPVDIVGEIAPDSAIYKLLTKYVRHVKFGGRPVDARFATGFGQLLTHWHFNLFALHYYA
jgi:hypothetical protein